MSKREREKNRSVGKMKSHRDFRHFIRIIASLLLSLLTLLSIIISLSIVIEAHRLYSIECFCQNGTNGLPGANDSCVCCPEDDPYMGIFSTQAFSTVLGSAQYVNTDLNPGNNNRANGQPIRFRILPTYNDIPLDIATFINSAGTIFNLSKGTYELVYGTSLTSAGSLCIYNGSSTGSMSPLLESMIGSTVANTWIHGNYFFQCNSLPCLMKLSPYNSSTLTIATAPSLSASTGAVVQISLIKIY